MELKSVDSCHIYSFVLNLNYVLFCSCNLKPNTCWFGYCGFIY